MAREANSREPCTLGQTRVKESRRSERAGWPVSRRRERTSKPFTSPRDRLPPPGVRCQDLAEPVRCALDKWCMTTRRRGGRPRECCEVRFVALPRGECGSALLRGLLRREPRTRQPPRRLRNSPPEWSRLASSVPGNGSTSREPPLPSGRRAKSRTSAVSARTTPQEEREPSTEESEPPCAGGPARGSRDRRAVWRAR